MSRSYIPKALREQVAADARHRCGYCLTSSNIIGTPMEIDHIIPESLGGLTIRENLWLACSMCNDHKGTR
ncbi:MAG: HNH endonuclease, partial [Verrucomicrobia bacterium]|nr:HNH endonuclease [Verrucomicrobiota bacterium]